MDVVATKELICALLDSLMINFGVPANLEDMFLEEPATGEGTVTMYEGKRTIIVIGASHCSRLCRDLRMRKWEVIDLSRPGWTPTVSNIQEVEKEIAKLGIFPSVPVVIDVLANVTFRYEQYDGSLALPCKIDGVYHMNGRVQVCDREAVVTTLDRAKGIFKALPGTKVVLTPIPRYLFKSCCDNQDHCTGTGEDAHVHHLLEGTVGLRKHIQDGLIKSGVTNFVVPDMIQRLTGEKTDIPKMADELRKITSQDNVHLTGAGYGTLADVVTATISESCTAPPSVSGPGAVPRPKFFWRGFQSPVGAARCKDKAMSFKMAHSAIGGNTNDGSKWRGTHPYRYEYRGRVRRGRGRPGRY
jgi:hypothetical protein